MPDAQHRAIYLMLDAQHWAIMIVADAWCTALSHTDAWCISNELWMHIIEPWHTVLSHNYWCMMQVIGANWTIIIINAWCTALSHDAQPKINDAWCTTLSYILMPDSIEVHGCTALSHIDALFSQHWAILMLNALLHWAEQFTFETGLHI